MTAQISARILLAIQLGSTIEEAIDAVLGAGTYEKMASEVYESLRK